MSFKILAYIKGLLSVAERATCVALSRLTAEFSHDGLTRILKNPRFEWQILLQNLILRIFGKLRDGFLIIDDTVIDKSFAKLIEYISWVYCSKKGRVILGLSVVVLAWSNGKITIPLAIRIWKKGSGKSKYDLALELLKYAKKIILLKPKYVTFDAWYASKKILRKIDKYGWTFITQIKRNRKFNGIPLKLYKRQPYWIEKGIIFGNLKVTIVRHGKKYFITNDLSLSKKEIISLYKGRWMVETLFRFLHSKLGLDECQAKSIRSQNAHIHLCLMTYLLLQKEKLLTGKTLYQLKRKYSFKPEKADLLLTKLKYQSA